MCLTFTKIHRRIMQNILNEDFRAIPPFSQGNPDFTFPDFEIINVNNKKVYLINDNTQPIVSFKFVFKKGAYHESIPGLAHFTAQMLTLGSKSRNAEEIAEFIDYYGAQLSSASFWDELVTSISCLADYNSQIIDLLCECIFSPRFDDAEIERLQKRQIAFIQQQNADPTYVTQIAFNEHFYKSGNYGHARIGYENTISAINKNEIIKFYEELIKSDFAVIVSGNFDKQNILSILENQLPKNIVGEVEDNVFDSFEVEKKLLIIDKEEATQAIFRFGKPSIKRTNPDFPAFITANTIFGGFFLSRLNENLREKKGLTYGIHSYSDNRRYFSTLMIATSINEENSKLAIDEINSELLKFNSEPVSEEEMARAVQYMLGSFARGMENHRQISSLIQTIESYNLATTYYQDIYGKIAKLTIEEVFETQKKYFTNENMLMIVSGNKSRLEKIIIGR